MSKPMDSEAAKRSITRFHGLVKTLVNEAKTYANTHNGGLTEGGKRQANDLVDKLNDQFSRMKKRWDDLSHLEVDEEKTYTDLELKFNDCRQGTEEAKNGLYGIIDKPTLNVAVAPPQPLPQAARAAPKMVTHFRPGIMQASFNLNEFNAWEKSFLGYFDANKDFLAASTAATRRIFITTMLDSKLQAALDADEAMVADTIAIKGTDPADPSILKWLRAHILRYQPLYIRRSQYMELKQSKNESFADFWTRKVLKGREADLQNINAEAIQITALITGLVDPKLREKCLRLKDPTLNDLIEIGHQFDLAKSVKKEHFGEVSANKTSDYQNTKKQNWNSSNSDGSRTGGNHGGIGSGSGSGQGGFRQGGNSRPGGNAQRNTCKSCGGSNPKCASGCVNKEVQCHACGRKGHLKWATFCPKFKETQKAKKAATEDSATMKSIRMTVRAVSINKAELLDLDDCAPTPICDMQFETENGNIFKHDVLPDTGCSQSLVSLNIAKANGMSINKNKKKNIRNASDEKMICNGTVVFKLDFQGVSTKVEALVSQDLKDEVLLGWAALKRLRIIHEDFPNPIPCPNQLDSSQSLNVVSCPPGRAPCQVVEAKACRAVSHGGPRCLKLFTKDNLYLGEDPKSNVEAAMAAFPKIFEEPSEAEGGLKIMKGDPMKIKLKPGPLKPTQVYTARKIPYAFEEFAKAELDKLVAMGVIEFCGYEATEWCSPCSFVRKPGGGMRSVVDLQGLNKYVMRPVHPFPTGRDIIAAIPKDSKVFAVYDALKGYFQVDLDEESRPLTTFITEFGRYRYRRAPMGLNASGDEFCLRTDKAVAGLPGVKKLVDDILLFAPSHDVLLDRIIGLFKRCQAHGITLSQSKFQYGSKVKFAGYIVDETGYRPDPSKLAAIGDFPVPKDLTNLRSFFGLVNQMAAFSPDLKHALSPLQLILKPKNKFLWMEEHQIAFDAVKAILTDENGLCLRHFDPKLPVTLTTDASRTGLGFILTQADTDGTVGLVQCGSRFLSPAEANYAVVELEAMAIQWAILKSKNYLLGAEFEVLTDHKPLEGIMNGRDLDSINNARLQRIMSKLIGYQFSVKYLPGKINFIADALSRSPVFTPEDHEVQDVLVQTLRIEAVDPQLEALIEAASKDVAYGKVVDAVSSKADWRNLPKQHPARLYRHCWDFLAFEKDVGLLSMNGRIVVPRAAQKAVLQGIHHQHTGQLKTYLNARQLYYWPHMKRDVQVMVSNCPECVAFMPSKPLPPLTQTEASRPFEAMSIDLAVFEGTHYLVVVDRFSGWINVAKLTGLKTDAVTTILEDWHLTFGKPQRLRTDRGPQFRSEFNEWCEANSIIHELSSPDHHESNGHAENAVKQVKNLLGKCDGNWKNFKKALFEWRNTPRTADGLSPSQWAFGRRQRSEAPALDIAYERISDREFFEALDKRGDRTDKVKQDFDVNRKPEPVFPDGTKVVVQRFTKNNKTGRWDQFGTIVSRRPNRTSYIVDIDGQEFIRSHLFLRLAPTPPSQEDRPIAPPSQEAENAQTEPAQVESSRRSKRKKNKPQRYGH